jgi:transcriptional regulator with XRE-family HTH domain
MKRHRFPTATRVGQMLHRLRCVQGLSQRELARRAHTSHVTLGRLETGKQGRWLETLARVAQALGVSLMVMPTLPCTGCGGERLAGGERMAELQRYTLEEIQRIADDFKRQAATSPVGDRTVTVPTAVEAFLAFLAGYHAIRLPPLPDAEPPEAR